MMLPQSGLYCPDGSKHVGYHSSLSQANFGGSLALKICKIVNCAVTDGSLAAVRVERFQSDLIEDFHIHIASSSERRLHVAASSTFHMNGDRYASRTATSRNAHISFDTPVTLCLDTRITFPTPRSSRLAKVHLSLSYEANDDLSEKKKAKENLRVLKGKMSKEERKQALHAAKNEQIRARRCPERLDCMKENGHGCVEMILSNYVETKGPTGTVLRLLRNKQMNKPFFDDVDNEEEEENSDDDADDHEQKRILLENRTIVIIDGRQMLHRKPTDPRCDGSSFHPHHINPRTIDDYYETSIGAELSEMAVIFASVLTYRSLPSKGSIPPTTIILPTSQPDSVQRRHKVTFAYQDVLQFHRLPKEQVKKKGYTDRRNLQGIDHCPSVELDDFHQPL
ncbi:hypothetical protein BLNAU_22778 [Blattamonas nauphoetae]|uniref:Uncharacterized protein n=1 Tax=Blattamonas nauphoetae TaxID=2049346 RepID=A0ABQ9WSK5_9EUKA|nr:hypothetical protein BLNAU_22778 [Blattamonas nauphoetae]